MDKVDMTVGMRVRCMTGPEGGRVGTVTHLMGALPRWCSVRFDPTPDTHECEFTVGVIRLQPVSAIDRLGDLSG